MIQKLSDSMLILSYETAKELALEPDFISLLEKEIKRRRLCVKEYKTS
jgi:hypothetical protein